MEAPYALRDSCVLFQGREELKRIELNDVVVHALRRRLRLAQYDQHFFRSLDTYGEASLTWNFTKQIGERDDHWATIEAWTLENGGHHLYCVGPQAEAVIEKINQALDKTPKWLKKKLKNEARTREGQRAKKKRTRRKKRVYAPTPKKPKTRKNKSHKHEVLTVQFHKNRIFWNEALTAVEGIFRVRRDAKNSARQIIARKLWRSLEHSDYQFAQFRQGGFCLQFTIVDGRWRGVDLTPVTVSCTKDNRNPYYRRMRKWLRKNLLGLPPKVQMVRRDLLFYEDRLVA